MDAFTTYIMGCRGFPKLFVTLKVLELCNCGFVGNIPRSILNLKNLNVVRCFTAYNMRALVDELLLHRKSWDFNNLYNNIDQ